MNIIKNCYCSAKAKIFIIGNADNTDLADEHGFFQLSDFTDFLNP